jgi:hypothetical protein
MEPAKAHAAEVSASDDFLAFPIHNVVGVFDDADDAKAAVTELRESGFPENEITTYHAGEDTEKPDFGSARHGTLPAFLRALQHYGPDRTYLERHEALLRDGCCLVMAHVKDKRHKVRAADIMHHHTRRHVTYFGTWVIQDV